MRTIIVGIISIFTAYKLSELLMIIFKGFTGFLLSSEDKITRLSGAIINDIFFSFPSVSILILTICSFLFIYFILEQLIDKFFEKEQS
jgi:hypothetical protein